MATDHIALEFRDRNNRRVEGLEHSLAHVVEAKRDVVRRITEDRRRDAERGWQHQPGRDVAVGGLLKPVAREEAGSTSRDILNIRIRSQGDFSVRPQGGGGSTGTAGGTRIDLGSLGTYKFTYAHATGDGRVTDVETYENLQTKKMGGYVRAINKSPGNKEYLIADAEGGFWWNYTPSRNCRLRFSIQAIQTYSRQFRDLVDEGHPFHPQISNVHLRQDNYITAGFFLNDTQRYGKSSSSVGPGSSYSGDGDHSNDSFGGPYQVFHAEGVADVDELVRDGIRSLEAAYSPSVSVQGGQEVCCFIGAQASIYADLDDVKATIRQGGTWLLQQLAVSEY